MTIIAMTREMGTLGKEVAREFARRRNCTVLHHELVESPGERARRDEESEVYRFLEGSEQEIDHWRNNRAKGGYLTPEEVFEIALEGDALIRGWGACRLLKNVPHVLSVRVCAPMERRVEEMKRRLGVDERSARREIERSDAAHSRTFLRFFEADWREASNYDVVLNTAHLSPEVCAEMLISTVGNGHFAATDETRRELEDRLLQARISSALAADGKLGPRGRHIHIAVDNAEVRLYGVVADGSSRQIAEDIAGAQPGIRRLHNDIVRARGFSE
jgi:cytidylate kinase